MKIELIKNHNVNQNNKLNNISFNGKVHKSVTNYIKDLRNGIIKSESSATSIISDNLSKVRNLKSAANVIKNITQRLKDFMDKTAKDTEFMFEFNRNTGAVYPMFRNKDTKIRAFRNGHWPRHAEKTASIHGSNVELPLFGKEKSRFFGLIKPKYSLNELEFLYKYTLELVEHVKPEDVDKALSERAIYEQAAYSKKLQNQKNNELVRKQGTAMIEQAVKDLKNIKID